MYDRFESVAAIKPHLAPMSASQSKQDLIERAFVEGQINTVSLTRGTD